MTSLFKIGREYAQLKTARSSPLFFLSKIKWYKPGISQTLFHSFGESRVLFVLFLIVGKPVVFFLTACASHHGTVAQVLELYS